MSRLDFLTPFYKKAHDRNSFWADVDRLLSAYPELQLHAFPLYTRVPVHAWADTLSESARVLEPVRLGDGVSRFRVALTYTQQGSRVRTAGELFVHESDACPNVYTLVSLENADFYRRAVRYGIAKRYPRVLTTFLKHVRLRALLKGFASHQHLRHLRITRASYRIRPLRRNGGRAEMPGIGWPDMTLDEAFDWVEQEDGWFQAIDCRALVRNKWLRLAITRSGEIRVNAFAELAHRLLLQPVCRILAQNVELFKKRARSETPQTRARPLVIEFADDQFRNAEELQRLVGAIRRFPASSASVLHANPYLHLSLLDYYDGSSFDLWVLSESQLAIVPQFRGSVEAIERIVHHISDAYAEGTIRDYEESRG